MAVAGPLNYQALDSNGDPVSGAKLYFFDAGTTTPRNVYSDAGLTSVIDPPVVANSSGWFQAIYIDNTAGDYKDRLHNASDVELRPDVDNIAPPITSTLPVSQGGTGATTASAARTALSVPSEAQHDAVDTRLTTAESTISNNIDTDEETLTWAASIEIDHSSQSTFQVTLAGSTTFTITGERDGGTFALLLIQDGTGSRSVTFSSDFVFAESQLRINQTANSKTLINGNVIGGKVYCKVQESIPILAVQLGKENSGAPGVATTGNWTTMPLTNGSLYDDGTLVSGAVANAFTLSAGEYRVCAWQSIDNTADFGLRLRDTGLTTTFGHLGLSVTADELGRGNVAYLDTGRFTIAAQETFIVQYWSESAGNLGVNVTGRSLDNLNALVNIERYT